MEKLIQPADLKEGDILLYHGTSWLSRAIRFFDGTDFNHASIYVSSNHVAESIAHGVVERDIETSVTNYTRVIVTRLNNRPDDMAPVTTKAREYLGNRYGYEQIILLALICSFRKIRLNKFVARFVNKVLESAATILLRFTHGGKEALICSELVYRSYDEAINGYGDPYTIYLDREGTIIKPEIFKAKEGHDYTNISESSIVSHFYGVNDNRAFRKRVLPPYVEDEHIAETIALSGSETIHTDKELEELFDEAVESYVQENYEISNEEEIKLKRSLDMFVTSVFLAKTKSEAFIASPNISEILTSFLSLSKDFVTPGDLYKAKNLQNIGSYKLNI